LKNKEKDQNGEEETDDKEGIKTEEKDDDDRPSSNLN
jgi:hypothetical protein